jgi:hypothetical protein
MPPDDHNRDRPENVTTWLVIPYFDEDVGRTGIERPVPPGKGVSWLCPSIIVDGTPGKTSFKRGAPITVELEVANWGAGTLPAAALVRLWWSDPTLAFATATKFAQTSVIVPPNGTPVRTGTFQVTIPEGASPHVCLLAQVSAPIDGASGVPNPITDRHWAQLNLVEAATVSAAGTIDLTVLLGNPYSAPMLSTLELEPMSRDEANFLGGMRGQDIRTDAGAEIEVRDPAAGEGRTLQLPPGSARQVKIAIRPADPPRRGAPQGYVLTQRLSRPQAGEEPTLTGTLGILVAPE